MDFGEVGFHSNCILMSSNSNSSVRFASDNINGSTSETNDNKLINKWFGSAGYYSKQDNEDGEEDVSRGSKVGKPSSSFGEQMLKMPSLQGSINVTSEGHNNQLMPSASSQNVALPPYYHHHRHQDSSSGYSKTAGINIGANTMQGLASISNVKGPFTPSQWLELEHQALIYKYITANVAVPPYLLNPIRKAFESAGFYSGLRLNPLGLGPFNLGFSNTDPEPGRCRRTDGKKWRCSREAVTDHKYCDRHMNRGRHRSRKPVEGHYGSITTTATAASDNNGQPMQKTSSIMSRTLVVSGNGLCSSFGISHQQHQPASNLQTVAKEVYKQKETPCSIITKHQNLLAESSQSEFGFVCSDSLLNPMHRSRYTSDDLDDHKKGDKSQHFLGQFMDGWPKNLVSEPSLDFMSSSTSSPIHKKLTSPPPPGLPHELDMGLTIAIPGNYQSRTHTNPAQLSWEGGPLGEVLHTSVGEYENLKPGPLDLMKDSWYTNNNNINFNNEDNNYQMYLPSSSLSPTGVLWRPELNSLSNSSAASSPRDESSGPIFARGLVSDPSMAVL